MAPWAGAAASAVAGPGASAAGAVTMGADAVDSVAASPVSSAPVDDVSNAAAAGAPVTGAGAGALSPQWVLHPPGLQKAPRVSPPNQGGWGGGGLFAF